MNRHKFLLITGLLLVGLGLVPGGFGRETYDLNPRQEVEIYCRGSNVGLYLWLPAADGYIRSVVLRCTQTPEGFTSRGRPHYWREVVTLRRGEEIVVNAMGRAHLGYVFHSSKVVRVYCY